jgi:hypothetical protein
VAGLATVGVPLGEVIPNAGKNAAKSMRENAYDIFTDRQAFKQQEKDDQTQFVVDDYFDTVNRAKNVIEEDEQATNLQSENVFDNRDQHVGTTEESVELEDLDFDDVQAEINALEATDVQTTSDESDTIDVVEIETAETENVDQAEIKELEATDVQTTSDESDTIDVIEIETAETENVDQAEIKELEATDVQITSDESDTIDVVEIETAETENVEQAEINELEANDVEATNDGVTTADIFEISGLEASDFESTRELGTDQVTEYRSAENILSTPEIDFDTPDVYLQHLDHQTNEFFAKLENETLVQANALYQSEEGATPNIVESYSVSDGQNMVVNADFGAEIKKQELETNRMSLDEKAVFDALLAEVRGE